MDPQDYAADLMAQYAIPDSVPEPQVTKLMKKINFKIGDYLAKKFENFKVDQDNFGVLLNFITRFNQEEEAKKTDEEEVEGEYVEGATPELRPEFTYKNGNVYTGEWNGGFKEG